MARTLVVVTGRISLRLTQETGLKSTLVMDKNR